MPETFTFTNNNSVVISSLTYNEVGELVIAAKYNNIPVDQTIPLQKPCILAFDPSIMNFKIVRISEEDANGGILLLKSYLE